MKALEMNKELLVEKQGDKLVEEKVGIKLSTSAKFINI